uniref:Uridine kinase n=1 Tax=Leptocylindrus danicus TaxID=163516 RepID=A0A7S2KHB2_9STRA|mmetsp:Transcript_22867/g.34323  ORF Transcript_22867/g.34323 Transcript_22867/m.34323 type:complete len:207 (+) Transcript_22867:132-752(+)|eukprot:CAMPEP_0116008300 /NCGR_PEP_ID=MMETSP0321-20121206/2787_1 /TAXON_ID=163516 /ORGANISM="Leptocylindrus danicus var. danicus, Strain B650" /LENGTH=206 /DNA_ID=CAMNT_0003477109 /DNA_START=74 /DNA_END=694 /DNA_ORIENTATION=+
MTVPKLIVGIAGGTGAGKTTLARELYAALGKETNVSYIVHDNYYKDISHLSLEERAKTNFDHPDSLDTDLLIQHVKSLKGGENAHIPNYDFSTHMRTKEVTILEAKNIVLIEGILIFSEPKLVELMDLKVFVDTDSDIRLTRRLVRDTSERGRTVEQVIEQYHATVRPMHNQYVQPSKDVADIVIPHGSNPTALDMISAYLKSKLS